MVIKLQTWTPDTCDDPPCRIIQVWDTDDPLRIVRVAGFERQCDAHVSNHPVGKMRWADGNFKDIRAYHDYQRKWFLWRNNVQWKERVAAGEIPADEPMPDAIRQYDREPPTPGSVSVPTPSEIMALDRAYGWAMGHNARKSQVRTALDAIAKGLDHAELDFIWEGKGDSRVLHVRHKGKLNSAQQRQLQDLSDIQFGLNKVLVE